MGNRFIKIVFSVLAVGCAGYMLVSGLFTSQSQEEAMQAYRYERNGEVTYVSRTDADHIRENGFFSYADNELIVQLADSIDEEKVRQIARENEAELTGFISVTDTCQWTLQKSYELEELKTYADEIATLPEVEYASVNYFTEYQEQSQDMPSKESGKWEKDKYNWGYMDIHANQAWKYIDEMKSPINIGIMDMGFQVHEDLDYTILRQGSLKKEETLLDKAKKLILTDRLMDLSSSQPSHKDAQHGTHVTGIAAAVCNNKKGIAGVYPNPTGQGEIYAYAIVYEDGAAISTIQQMNDVARMLLNDTKVINMSVGLKDAACYSAYKEHDSTERRSHVEEFLNDRGEVWEDYLGRFIDKGYEFLIFNTAGNASNHSQGSGTGKLYKAIEAPEGSAQYELVWKGGESAVIGAEYSYPLTYLDDRKVKERIICVGAYGKDRLLTRFSNMSQRVDILAPGFDIYSTCNDSLKSKDGTSMAAPYVTGTAACIWSLDERLTASEVRQLLLQEMYDDVNPETILDVDTNVTKPILNLEASINQASRYVEEHQEELQERTVNHGIPMIIIAKIAGDGVELKLTGTREQRAEELKKYAKKVMIEDAVITIRNEDGEVLYDHKELLQKASKASESERDDKLINFFLPEGNYTVTVEAEGYEPLTVKNMNPRQGYPTNSLAIAYDFVGMTTWEFELEPIVDSKLLIDPKWWGKKDYTNQFMKYLEEKLIPEYGVMPTQEIVKMPGYMDMVWLEPEELQGILAVKIDDYDGDKRNEMLLVRSACEQMDRDELMETDDRGGGTGIFLEMYEYSNKVKLTDSIELIPCGKYRVMSDRVHTGVFTYSNDGTEYIGIDNYLYMEGGTTTVSLYRYKDGTFQYVKGTCRQWLVSGYESVSETDHEPEADEITMGTAAWTGDGSAWKQAGDYYASGRTEEREEVRENIQKLDAIYADLLKEYGLLSNDVRLYWYNQDWDNQDWDARTADIYTAEEGELSVVASMATCYIYRDMREYHLFREDPAGSLDAYR